MCPQNQEIADASQRASNWIAVSVKPRFEKSVSRMLDFKGYTTVVPQITEIRRRTNGTVWRSERPIISGYVFVAEDLSHSLRIVETPGVLRIVGFGNGPCLIPSAEIEAIERIGAMHLPVSETEYLQTGQQVCIQSGPLRGVQGILVRHDADTRLVVSVNLLQRSLEVRINREWLSGRAESSAA